MPELQIARYEKRIAEEERMASDAISPELALAHRQVAMIYQSELSMMRRKRSASVSEMLADLG